MLKKVKVVNPASAYFGKIGEVIGVPAPPGLSEEEKIKQRMKEYEAKVDEYYLVRFPDGQILNFGAWELIPVD